jgi:P27 family predicted phage terminase small subunit
MGGRTGRARKPVSLMDAQGTANKSRLRQQGRLGVRLARGVPDYPPQFDDALKPSFDSLADLLNTRGVLTSQDGVALGELVYTHHLLLRLRHMLDKMTVEEMFVTIKGRTKEHPLLRLVRALQNDLVRLLARFGLTPRDREKIGIIPQVAPEPANDPWSRLLERKN